MLGKNGLLYLNSNKELNVTVTSLNQQALLKKILKKNYLKF